MTKDEKAEAFFTGFVKPVVDKDLLPLNDRFEFSHTIVGGVLTLNMRKMGGKRNRNWLANQLRAVAYNQGAREFEVKALDGQIVITF